MTAAEFPLDLTYSEGFHACGYAPRAVHLATRPDGNARTLYVGCKDGTVWTLDELDQGNPQAEVALAGHPTSGVRCLYELTPGLVLIGRNNGQLELFDCRERDLPPQCLARETELLQHLDDNPIPTRFGGSVRRIGRTDSQRLYVSFRRLGTIILDLHRDALEGKNLSDATKHLKGVLQEALDSRAFLTCDEKRNLTSIQLITQLVTAEGSCAPLWFIATEEARIYRWEGDPSAPAEPLNLWPAGERPVLVNDFALMRHSSAKEGWAHDEAIEGVFLATDRGVHLFTREGDGVSMAQRLSLPGLGRVCMSITHVKDDRSTGRGRGWHYLWAIDAEGSAHLFCDDRRDDLAATNYRPSGHSRLASQVLLAVAYREADPGDEFSLALAQTRRDDTIALGRYRELSRAGLHSDLKAKARRALSSENPRVVGRYLREIQKSNPHLAELWRDHDFGHDKWLRLAARVSELVQAVAASPVTRGAFQEFLDNPSATYSLTILDNLGTPESLSVEDTLRVLDLWTVSFIGVINRYLSSEKPGSRELPETARRYHLGLLRWLGQLREHFESREHHKRIPRDHHERIQRRFDACTRMVRKWGLFGDQDGKRRALAHPLRVLDERTDRHPGERVDLLTYDALLYSRGIDRVFEERERELEGRTARSISAAHLRTRGHLEKWVGVSWQWGGIELFRVRKETGSIRIELEFVLAIPPPQTAGDPSAIRKQRLELAEIQQTKWGQSRILQLEVSPNQKSLYLLSSPFFDRDRVESEEILLYVLPISEGRLDVDSLKGLAPVSSLQLPPSHVEGTCESSYSLLPLGGQRFVVGLRGTAGMARIWAIEIRDDILREWGEAVEAPRSIAGARMADENRPAISQNRIWCLAGPFLEKPPTTGSTPEVLEYEFVAGCDNGEIWRLAWPRSAAPSQEVVTRQGRFELVARQSESVRAIAYRKHYGSGDFLSRVFAGGDDGTLLAWQEEVSSEDDRSGKFISLWATAEAGPVSALHLWPYQANHPKAPPVLVVAVFRDGQAVLFDDRAGPVAGQNPRYKTPRRVQFPGNRHSRLRLRATAYASHLCDKQNLSDDLETDRQDLLGVLLIASDRGIVQGLALHHPRYTPKRKAAFHSLVRRWWRSARSDPQRPGNIQYHLADAVYRAAPDLSLILVRWLLDPALDPDLAADSKPIEALGGPTITADEPPRWQLPRYVRPLLDLRRLWMQIDLPDSEIDLSSEMHYRLSRIEASLTLALRLVRELGDVRMFQEICECVLKRANFILFQAAESDDIEERHWAQATFGRVMASIDNALERWHGMPDYAERLVRVVVAKSFFDGDTFLRVLRESAKEEPAGPRLIPREWAASRKSRSESKPFSKVLQRRVLGARELIFKTDPVVRLESIRAANLSLLRLCYRLTPTEERRFRLGGPEVPPTEIRWEEFEIFFEHLTFAAARVFQSPHEIGEALAHEYARTFALAVCACPSAAVRIGYSMTETRLIADLDSEQDLCRRVEKQIILLGSIGVPVPPDIQRLFVLVTQGPLEELWDEFLDTDGGSEETEPLDLGTFTDWKAPKLGYQNAEVLFCVDRLLRILRWLEGLADAMASNVADLKFSRDAFERAKRHLADLQEESVRGFYTSSRAFWLQALDKLAHVDVFVEQASPISPRVLLASRHLATWTKEQLDVLDQRYRDLEIFQPEISYYRRILQRLREAAKAFPKSAAVQKAVVVGVLGHHLLEDLDEHTLELEELAHALDPVLVDEFRERDRRPLPITHHGPMARRFSAYLLRRAQHASSSPKNLRILYGLLDSTPTGKARSNGGLRLAKLLAAYSASSAADPVQARVPEIFRWDTSTIPDDWGPSLSDWEAAHLELVLEELHQNHRKHSRVPTDRVERNGDTDLPRPRIELGRTGMALEMAFTFELGSENLKRLQRLLQGTEQDRPMEPSERMEVPSTGTGLYLGRLAAAVVGWHFSVRDAEVHPDDDRLGICKFSLRPFGSETQA